MNKVVIKSDVGGYTLSGRELTLTGLDFTPIQEQLAYLFNYTQNTLYYAPAEDIARAVVAGAVKGGRMMARSLQQHIILALQPIFQKMRLHCNSHISDNSV